MKHEIVDLVVAVDYACPVDGLHYWVSKELDHLVEMRDLANRNLRFHVHCLGLRCRDRTQGLDLAAIETVRLPEVGEAMHICINVMKFPKRSNSIMPPDLHQDEARSKGGGLTSPFGHRR